MQGQKWDSLSYPNAIKLMFSFSDYPTQGPSQTYITPYL